MIHISSVRLSRATPTILLGLAALLSAPSLSLAQQQVGPQPVVQHIKAANERLELIVNTSRILTLDQPIPQVQVSNPDIVTVTPLSPTEVQIFAKKSGATQVNLWNDKKEIFTVDVLAVGDARELATYLHSMFPKASLKVTPLANSVVISGFVDDPSQINQITSIAEDYYPKIHNHVIVGGGQEVLLQVRVMEISRTKLRTLGIDFANISQSGAFAASGIDGVLKMATVPSQVVTGTNALASTGGETLSFGVINSGSMFFGFLEALRQDQLARVLAEPNLVTVSGRPAYFNVGGEFPILIPQSLGTVSIQYKPYGTQVDFVPIVLGNGAIKLEVRPRISVIDTTLSVQINNTSVPALNVREVDTAVEMRAGQTLAIAGLVQNRVDTTKRSIPFLGDLPYIGAFFSKKTEQMNEVELLILVTPQLVDAMNPPEVPTCGPGQDTASPTDVQFYFKNYIEVPKLCPPGTPGPGAVPGAPQFDAAPAIGEPVPPANSLPAPETPPAATPQTLQRTPALGNPDMRSAAAGPGGVRIVPDQTSSRTASNISYDRSNPYRSPTPQTSSTANPAKQSSSPGFIGPVGYDVLK